MDRWLYCIRHNIYCRKKLVSESEEFSNIFKSRFKDDHEYADVESLISRIGFEKELNEKINQDFAKNTFCTPYFLSLDELNAILPTTNAFIIQDKTQPEVIVCIGKYIYETSKENLNAAIANTSQVYYIKDENLHVERLTYSGYYRSEEEYKQHRDYAAITCVTYFNSSSLLHNIAFSTGKRFNQYFTNLQFDNDGELKHRGWALDPNKQYGYVIGFSAVKIKKNGNRMVFTNDKNPLFEEYAHAYLNTDHIINRISDNTVINAFLCKYIEYLKQTNTREASRIKKILEELSAYQNLDEVLMFTMMPGDRFTVCITSVFMGDLSQVRFSDEGMDKFKKLFNNFDFSKYVKFGKYSTIYINLDLLKKQIDKGVITYEYNIENSILYLKSGRKRVKYLVNNANSLNIFTGIIPDEELNNIKALRIIT